MSRSLQKNFRVPKKVNMQLLELLVDNNDQKQFLHQKLLDSFRKPEISKNNMQFLQFWSIKNSNAESDYTKRRQVLKLKNQSFTEYFGFYFIKTEYELQKLAMKGQLKIGNLPDSKLGTGSMGVSLSLFCDVFHPGDENNTMPNKGILLIVKYLKGKINYVQYDDNPTDPQPGFNCHIVRKFLQLEINPTLKKAFHSTQVFLYDYTEDIDIVEYPTQLVIIGAVKFTSTRKCIFRSTTNKTDPGKTLKRLPDFNISDKFPPVKSGKSKIIYTKFIKSNVTNTLVNLISGDLIVGIATSKKIKINVSLTTRFREPIQLHNLKAVNWDLSEVIPNENFLEFFTYLDINGTKQVLKISTTTVTQLPPTFYDGKFILLDKKPKHVVYLQMSHSVLFEKKSFQRLCDILQSTSGVGRITTVSFPNILFYTFPSGMISDQLGIPRENFLYLNVLLLFSVHPDIGSTNVLYQEDYNFVTLLNQYYSQIGKEKKSLISYNTLKQTVKDQSVQLKDLFKKLLARPLSNMQNMNDGSDMDIDSDVDSERSCKRRRLSGVNYQTKAVDKDYRQGIVQHIVIPRLPEIPIRTPVSLPDVICFDKPSLEWAHLTKPIIESTDIESSSSSIANNTAISQPHFSQIIESSNLLQTQIISITSPKTVQNRITHQSQVNGICEVILQPSTSGHIIYKNADPSCVPDVIQIHSSKHVTSQNVSLTNVVLECQPNHVSFQTNVQNVAGEVYSKLNARDINNQYLDQGLTPPLHSQMLISLNNVHDPIIYSTSSMYCQSKTLLPTPIITSCESQLKRVVSSENYEPNGLFKLISVSRNYRRPKTKVVGPTRIRSMEIMPAFKFISIYKG